MITLTLEVYYLPIKKLVMLYTLAISIIFNGTKQLFEDQEMLDISANNRLTENYLSEFRNSNKPESIKISVNPVEKFYVILKICRQNIILGSVHWLSQ